MGSNKQARGARAAATALAVAAVVFLAPAASAKHFDATFDPVAGNEWWVEVNVDGNEPLESVQARANGGEWRDLDRTDWGSWAKSFFVPDGSVVQFRAIEPGSGETVYSDHYRWPDAEFLACPPAFDAEFDPVPGNEWWVEVNVRGVAAQVTAVDARVDGGEWHALDRTDWGSWAKSFFVEEDSRIEFRAEAGAEGQTDFSDVYRWPDAKRVTDGVELDAAFGPKASSEWWVETYAVAERPIEKVEACRGDGEWHELEFRDWHAWAKSFFVPDGSEVQFRATDDRGLTDTSAEFEWPGAEPVEDDGAWPREGSYAHYELEWGAGSMKVGDVDAIFVHHDGDWRVLCEGEGARGEDFFEYHEFAPPFGPTATDVGEDETVSVLHGCDRNTIEVTVEETRERDTRKDGDPVTVTTWFGERVTDFDHRNADWETGTGLLVRYFNGGTGWGSATLEDTNAPVDG